MQLLQWIKRLFGRASPQGSARLAADDARIEQVVMGALLSRWGARALYCPDLETERQAVKAAQHLPLFYVWGQHMTAEGVSFTFGLNGLLVAGSLMAHLSPELARYKRLKRRIERRLHRAAYEALMAECDALDLTPRELLDHHAIPRAEENPPDCS